jgi:hypothetical protein
MERRFVLGLAVAAFVVAAFLFGFNHPKAADISDSAGFVLFAAALVRG